MSALNIPHSSIVFDHHRSKIIRTETLGGNGVAEVTLRYADLVAFTCLKAYAVDQRDERKDAHDLIYCLSYYEEDLRQPPTETRAAVQCNKGRRRRTSSTFSHATLPTTAARKAISRSAR